MTAALSLLLFGLGTTGLAATETRDIELPTQRGPRLQARLTLPDEGTGPHPALIIAPGAGFDMDQPVFERASQLLADKGFVVLRFNWDFYSRKTKRSRRLLSESEDLRTAVAHVRAMSDVDNDRIYVLGMSLGSIVAAQLAQRNEPVAALILLTPPLHAAGDSDQRWPLFETTAGLKLPLFLIGAEQDSICNPDVLRELAGKCQSKPEVLVVPGTHRLEASSEEETRRSHERIAQAVTAWLTEQAADKGNTGREP